MDPWEKAISDYIAPLSRVEVGEIAREALKIETSGGLEPLMRGASPPSSRTKAGSRAKTIGAGSIRA